MSNPINYKNLYSLFNQFDEHTDCYPGVMFINIYNEFPVCYNFSFTNTDKISYVKYIDKVSTKEIKHTLDDRYLLRGFMDNDKFEVIQYSPVEYLILGKEFSFLTIIDVSESDKSVSLYQNIFVSSKMTSIDLEELYFMIAPYFKSIKRDETIDFGIAAVDVSGVLYTNYYDFNPIEVDINKNYNDDLPYDRIKEIIETEKEAALMLFYGEPGTGKSSLIKKFLSEFPEKDFVFMDGTLLANVQQDRLMSYFLENQDTVFIFEDCEKILLNRDKNYNPTMSILLNLTDGIISDVLNIKIICTFNTSLNNIDKALLRKGRLTLKYEFKKLNKEKVRDILNDETINEDMSLADIYHYKEENDYSKKQQSKIGF